MSDSILIAVMAFIVLGLVIINHKTRERARKAKEQGEKHEGVLDQTKLLIIGIIIIFVLCAIISAILPLLGYE